MKPGKTCSSAIGSAGGLSRWHTARCSRRPQHRRNYRGADLAHLDSAKLTAKRIPDRLKDLQVLPAISFGADKIDLAERIIMLNALDQTIRQLQKESS